jgi:hypothetical protein
MIFSSAFNVISLAHILILRESYLLLQNDWRLLLIVRRVLVCSKLLEHVIYLVHVFGRHLLVVCGTYNNGLTTIMRLSKVLCWKWYLFIHIQLDTVHTTLFSVCSWSFYVLDLIDSMNILRALHAWIQTVLFLADDACVSNKSLAARRPWSMRRTLTVSKAPDSELLLVAKLAGGVDALLALQILAGELLYLSLNGILHEVLWLRRRVVTLRVATAVVWASRLIIGNALPQRLLGRKRRRRADSNSLASHLVVHILVALEPAGASRVGQVIVHDLATLSLSLDTTCGWHQVIGFYHVIGLKRHARLNSLLAVGIRVLLQSRNSSHIPSSVKHWSVTCVDR